MSRSLASSQTPHWRQPFCLILASHWTSRAIAETRGEDAPVAPLFACLATEIHYTAALAGSYQPGCRLDPPLLLTTISAIMNPRSWAPAFG